MRGGLATIPGYGTKQADLRSNDLAHKLWKRGRKRKYKSASHKPNRIANDGPDDPESRALQESLFDTRTSRACGGCAIRQRAIEDDGLGTIDRTNSHETAVHVRGAAVPQERIDIGRIAVVITPTGVVLLAETGDGQRLVDAIRIAGVGGCAIHEAIRMKVGIGVGTVKPKPWKDSKSRTAKKIRSNTRR